MINWEVYAKLGFLRSKDTCGCSPLNLGDLITLSHHQKMKVEEIRTGYFRPAVSFHNSFTCRARCTVETSVEL